MSVTAIILTKNEELNISSCINSVKKVADKVIVIDSYSNDNTVKISKELGAEVFQREFKSHSEQFNWALNNIKIDSEWIFRIDADEVLTCSLVEELNTVLPNIDSSINGIFLNRRRYFLGKWIKHGDVYPERVLRIFRNGTAKSENRIMDEHIVLLNGKSIYLNNDIEDRDSKDLTFWINKHNWYSNREAEEFIKLLDEISKSDDVSENLFGNYIERKRWLKNNIYYRLPLFIRPMLYFLYRYIIKLGFLDGIEGLIYHFMQGYWYRFLVDCKVYEKKSVRRISNE